MKQRFSSIDVKLICEELRPALTGLRISNIYDLSSVSASEGYFFLSSSTVKKANDLI